MKETEQVNEAHLMLTLYFCEHGSEDNNSLKGLLSQSTILVYEHAWCGSDDHEIEATLNKLARGVLTPEQVAAKYPSSGGVHSANPLHRSIYRSMVRIVLERSPATEEELDEFAELSFDDPNPNLPMKEQVQYVKEIFRRQAAVDEKRDRALAGQLKRLTQENPTARILVVRGQGHRHSLPAFCRQEGLYPKTVYGYLDQCVQLEVIALMAAGKEPTVDQLTDALGERWANIRTL